MAKSVKNPQKNKEIKPKDDKTAQQEQCSVVAIYYYMTKDMKSQAVRDELLEKFKVIYPDVTSKDGIAWTNTFLEQGRLIANASEYVKKGASYQYGWWDAPPRAMNSTKFSQAIGRQNTTSLMTRIWDKYFDKKIINARVHERGVGETDACGSGAVCMFYYLYNTNQVNNNSLIFYPGGELEMSIEKEIVKLSGEVTYL